MRKIETIIKITEDSGVVIQEKFKVSEFYIAKEIYSHKLNILMRILASRGEETTPQMSFKLDDESNREEEEEQEITQTQKEQCETCHFILNNECELCGELPEQTKEASCTYFMQFLAAAKNNQDFLDITELLAAQIAKQEKVMAKSRLVFADEMYTKTIKARKCFIGSLNEQIRGLQEAVELTFDTEVNLYLYDEKFLSETLMPLHSVEIDRYIQQQISEQTRLVCDMQSRLIGLKKAIQSYAVKVVAEGVIKKENNEAELPQPAKKRSYKKS